MTSLRSRLCSLIVHARNKTPDRRIGSRPAAAFDGGPAKQGMLGGWKRSIALRATRSTA